MTLSILNVGDGDTKISFDAAKPAEIERTRRIVGDLLRLGYAILVRVGETPSGKPKYRRAVAFDPQRDEYLVLDAPAEAAQAPAKAPRGKPQGRPRRVPAAGTTGVAVARSAGGMSSAVDSVEMQNLERFDAWAHTRNGLRALASIKDQWAGIPMPLEDAPLVMEPRYPLADALRTVAPAVATETDDADAKLTLRNRFYSVHQRREVLIWSEPSGRIEWGLAGGVHHFDYDLQTMRCSVAWGVEQEAHALQMLATLLPHHAFKKYLLSGMFIEKSERSGIFYLFRRLKPTVAASAATGTIRIIAVLCQHPIAYYQGTWAGAMCPTDDVIAALMLMRGDEPMFWKRCNQHAAHRPESGL